MRPPSREALAKGTAIALTVLGSLEVVDLAVRWVSDSVARTAPGPEPSAIPGPLSSGPLLTYGVGMILAIAVVCAGVVGLSRRRTGRKYAFGLGFLAAVVVAYTALLGNVWWSPTWPTSWVWCAIGSLTFFQAVVAVVGERRRVGRQSGSPNAATR